MSESPAPALAQPDSRAMRGQAWRVWALAITLAIELVPISMVHHKWFQVKPVVFPTIFFFLALLFFGRAKLRAIQWDGAPIDMRMIFLHGCALAALFAANLYLLLDARRGSGPATAALAIWYAAVALVPVTIARALFPLRKLLAVLVGLGKAWAFAAGCALLMLCSRSLLLLAWDAPASRIGQAIQVVTFNGVHWLLSLVYPTRLIFDQPSTSLGTDRYAVQIQGVCSGIEGMGLMLALTVGWLVYSRRELRIARAMLLVPVSLTLIFLLNMARIAALIALGDGGLGSVAEAGFHSEAGWILFSGVALGFLTLVNRVAWFQQAGGGDGIALGVHGRERERNPAAIYLLPFLAILATSLVSQAASAGFEWLYGLRLPAVLVVGYAYRREYQAMDWSFGWLGPVAGAAVFGIWIALAHWAVPAGAGSAVAAGLAQLSLSERVAWILLRVTTAVAAVPFAEELAFRGFLARRIMSDDVERVSLQRVSVLAVLVSSLLFGAMHGRMWFAGTLAGIAFCVLAKRRGRLGEAVAAHATANLMIAVWVLARGDYSLW